MLFVIEYSCPLNIAFYFLNIIMLYCCSPFNLVLTYGVSGKVISAVSTRLLTECLILTAGGLIERIIGSLFSMELMEGYIS